MSLTVLISLTVGSSCGNVFDSTSSNFSSKLGKSVASIPFAIIENKDISIID